MGRTLAFLEGSAIFVAISGTALVWARPHLDNWVEVVAVLGQAFALSLCCIAAFCLLRVRSSGTLRSRPRIERVLILGTSPLAHRLIQEIETQPHCRYAVVGVVDDSPACRDSRFSCPLLGPLERLARIIEEVRPDRIIVALAERRGGLPVAQLLEPRARGIIVEEGVEAYERLTGKLPIEWLAPSSLLYAGGFRKSHLYEPIAGGARIFIAAVGLIVLAPLFGLIGLAIKLDSRGPVLFVQDRVGRGGKPFTLLKFRTMHPVNQHTSEWVRDNSHRITRVGKWLRRFRLDELPQLVNILRGDMNLVGPRPHPLSNFDLFVLVSRNAPECGQQIPYYSFRSMVRPGLTGWAQVRYRYANDVEEEIEKMKYDLYYIKHMSLRLDLRILFDTVRVVLLGRGAETPEVSPTVATLGVRRPWPLPTNVNRKRAA